MTSLWPSKLVGFSQDALTQDKFIGGKLLLWQPKSGFRAATDPVLLAAACPARPGEHVLDLGCGVGTAALCLMARVEVAATGLELQPDYATLAARNARENNLPLEVITGDITDMPAELKEQSFDHVITNPPFFGPGKRAEDAGRAAARQAETDLGIWIDAGLKRLKPGGWLTIIHLTERLPEVIVALNKRAGAISIKPLSPRESRPATRFILRARKGSRGPAHLSSPLILHEGSHHQGDRDDFTAEAREILRNAGSLEFS